MSKLWIVAFLCALLLLGVASGSDVCSHPGELRRHYGCVAVRHTKSDACCWMKKDGTHGKLPYTCCGTGWKSAKCEEVIDNVCETHPDDM